MHIATQKGLHPAKVIEQFIVDGIALSAEMEEFSSSVDIQVYAGVYEVRRRARIRSQLVQIAFEHQQNPTEESADALRSLCELADVAVEEIIEESEDAALVPIIQDNGHGVASAVRWLKQVIEDGNEYPVTYLLELAYQAGFSQATIKSAKQTLGIVSRRKSNCWVWLRPTHEDVTTMN
jgi:hypothetical protein